MSIEREIIIDKFGATSAEGIFAAGDVTDVPYKQSSNVKSYHAIGSKNFCSVILLTGTAIPGICMAL